LRKRIGTGGGEPFPIAQSLQKKLGIHFSELIEPLKTPLVEFNFDLLRGKVTGGVTTKT
jgi:hypothetical protein